MGVLQEGGCQCGAVRYRITGDPVALAVCHCTQCQMQSGSAFGMSLLVRRERFEILQGVLRSFVKVADSGNRLECFFCAECGVRIYHSPESSPKTFTVKPGTLDDRSWLRPTLQVWTRSQQEWVSLAGDLRSFERNPRV